MTLVTARASGFADGTRLRGSEITAMDNNIVLALDTRGGTYVQSSPIVFSGDAWTLEQLTVADQTVIGSSSSDTLTVNATSTFGSQVQVNDDILLTGAVVADGPISAGTTATVGTNLTVNGSATLGDSIADTIIVNGTTEFNRAVSLDGQFVQTGASNHIETGGNLVAQGTLDVTGTGVIDGNTTLGGTLAVAGATTISSGSSVPGRFLDMVDSDTTASWTDYNVIRVGFAAALTADRALTLTAAGVPDGAIYEVFASPGSTVYSATIIHANGVASVRHTDGFFRQVRLVVDTGVLYIMGGDFRPL